MDNKAMFNFSYGMFVLTARVGDKDNGCIINTAMQLTTNPNQVLISVNKANYTHDMIMNTKKFNLSILDNTVTFDTFKHFGFQSGRDVNKFEDINYKRSPNGIAYLPQYANAWISGWVTQTIDLGTHTMFIATVAGCEVLNHNPSLTYADYHKNVKPKPQETKKKGYRCKVCGFVYEGDKLPEDYICPLCKHGIEDFEKI